MSKLPALTMRLLAYKLNFLHLTLLCCSVTLYADLSQVKVPVTEGPRVAMKPLHWTNILHASVFDNLTPGVVDIDFIDENFAKSKTTEKTGATTSVTLASKKVGISLLDAQRELIMSIQIGGLKKQMTNFNSTEALQQAIFGMDSCLDDEMVVCLLKLLPSADEIKTFASFAGDITTLTPTDQFMSSLASIPYLEHRLRSMQTMREFSGVVASADAQLKVSTANPH